MQNDGTYDLLNHYMVFSDNPIDSEMKYCKIKKSIVSFLEAVTPRKQSHGIFIDLSITVNRQGQSDKIPRKCIAPVLWGCDLFLYRYCFQDHE